jgi:hypothetical protein
MVTTRDDYEGLLEQFLKGDIDASEFDRRYWELYNRHDYQGTREEDDILLGYLSAEVDAFREDPTLRDELSIDEVQLKEAATKALEALNKLYVKPLREPLTNRFTKYAKKLLRHENKDG